jgi:putative SOS response-associated peptidase YedK
MCGRYLLDADVRRLERSFGPELSQKPRDLPLRFNIAPTQPVPIVRRDGAGGRELVTVRRGLIPAWAEEASIGGRLINARAEGIADKPSFRAAFRGRRCVVPASGFYEWQRWATGPKRPHLIRRRDWEPIGSAGLWESWRDPATGEAVESCVIVTCEPNELMAGLHDRMPVILAPDDYGTRLEAPPPAAAGLLRPCPAGWLEAVPVSTRVNNPANDDEGLIRPLGEPATGPAPAQGALL